MSPDAHSLRWPGNADIQYRSLICANRSFCQHYRRHCNGIRHLDVSFNRRIREDALGALVEASSGLKSLHLFGCDQFSTRLYNLRGPSLDIQGFFSAGASRMM